MITFYLDDFVVSEEEVFPEMLSSADYYAFGMPIPGRQFNSGDYRFGFNGKENDNEVKGNGNQQDYGMRIYDPRLGRFLSVDPIAKDFAWNSPYAFAENDVIRSIDLDGREKSFVFYDPNRSGNTEVKRVQWSEIYPGQEHGPLGSGEMLSKYDATSKKWGQGQYQQSYEDAFPIRSALQKGDERYKGDEGFKNLANDVGTGIKAIGVVTGNPILYKAGDIMGDVGDAHEAIVTKDATKGTIIVAGALTEKLLGIPVNASKATKEAKEATDAAIDIAVDQLKDEAETVLKGKNSDKKVKD